MQFSLFTQHLECSMLNSDSLGATIVCILWALFKVRYICIKCNCRSDNLRAFDNNVDNERCLCYFLCSFFSLSIFFRTFLSFEIFCRTITRHTQNFSFYGYVYGKLTNPIKALCLLFQKQLTNNPK